MKNLLIGLAKTILPVVGLVLLCYAELFMHFVALAVISSGVLLLAHFAQEFAPTDYD